MHEIETQWSFDDLMQAWEFEKAFMRLEQRAQKRAANGAG